MTAQEIIDLIKEHLEENTLPNDQEPEDPDAIIKMGKEELCIDLLKAICPKWDATRKERK